RGCCTPETLLKSCKLRERPGPCQEERIHPKHRRSKTAGACCSSVRWPAAWAYLRPRCAPGKPWASSRRSARRTDTVSSLRLMCPNQRKVLETTPDVRMELLAWGNTAMEPHLFRIKPGGGSGESYSHEGEEFLHVLRGDFEIWLDTKEHYHLKPGDSLYFESSTPHRWKNPGRKETWLLWINTPPTF